MKKRKIKKELRSIFIIILLCFLGAVIGFYIQRKVNYINIPVSVKYSIVDTKKINEATMVMVGDALIHQPIYVQHKTSNGYDFKDIFKHTKEIFTSYDLAYYNQETILGGAAIGLSTYPQFNSPIEVGEAFVDAGFDIVSLATNHTLDGRYRYSNKAIENSRKFWDSQENIIAAGSYTSKEERETLRIKEKNGITYTLLSYTTTTNGLPVPAGQEYLVDVYTKEKVKNDVEKYRDKVDVIMVAMHWGVEYQHYPSEAQKSIAKYLESIGVNIVIGCHPHVIQPIDYINDTLVIYSLGNFVSSQIGIERLTGLMASTKIVKEVYHGKTTIKFVDTMGDLIYTDKSNKYLVYPYSKLNDSILPSYKTYYKKYGDIITKYNKNVTMKGL